MARTFIVSEQFVVGESLFQARVSAYHEAVWEAFRDRGELIVFMHGAGEGYIGAGTVTCVDGRGVVVSGHGARRLGWLTTWLVARLARYA